MTQRSDFASALQNLRILAGEPGVHMRWQETIRAGIAAMEGAQDLLPPDPVPEPEPVLVEEPAPAVDDGDVEDVEVKKSKSKGK